MAKIPKNDDSYWMGLALREAVKARGHTSPNPMVGAVLVKNGKLIAKGYHRRAGLPHAEIEAMKRAKGLKGATLYVTLEPCCHEGKRTPPCTQAILRSGIRKVVIGTLDPNPKVSGKGVKQLAKAGLVIEVGVLEEECRRLNLFYNHWVRQGRPWVMLKSATSLDGRVALANGRSQWITGVPARKWVHRLRHEVDAILVGAGTVLADDPKLNVRHGKASRQPQRVVLDPQLLSPLKAKVFSPKHGGPTWVVVHPRHARSRKAREFTAQGVQVLSCPVDRRGEFVLEKLLSLLGQAGIVSLLVEGGAQVLSSFYRQKAFDEWLMFLAPQLFGADAKAMVGELGLKQIPANALQLQDCERLGPDLLLVFRPSRRPE